MLTAGFFVRVLLAVLGVVLLFAILPPFFRIIGFPPSADVLLILKICVAAVAVFYVFTGRGPAVG